MDIEHEFTIKAKKKINYGLGITLPDQEVYDLLRDNGFYDLSVEHKKGSMAKIEEFLNLIKERIKDNEDLIVRVGGEERISKSALSLKIAEVMNAELYDD